MRSPDAKFGYGAGSRQEMISFVPPSAIDVLDVGCGAGGFGTALRQARPAISLVGIEPDVAVMSDAYDLVVSGAFPAGLETGDQRFDCIVFNDSLEHMVDPWSALQAAGRLLSRGGHVVASIPNVRNLRTLYQLAIKGDFAYEESGVLDRNHLRFFTPLSMVRLFNEAGFEVVGCEPINLPTRGRRGTARRMALGKLDRLLAEQFAVVAALDPRASSN